VLTDRPLELGHAGRDAPEPRQQLTDDVYERLRRAIVRGELRPNQRLIEADLAQRLEVSRTPIREALQRLTLDRLVVSQRRCWVVREHRPDEIREIYECRMALEGHAARLATERATGDEVRALDEILAGADLGRPPRQWMVPVNDAFHQAVIEAARNPMLAELCERSRLYYFNHRIAALYTREEAAESRDQHLRLRDAIRDRHPADAESLAHLHIATALRVLLHHLDEGLTP
jgi:DNA-binding GntR family transcriptional regulator